MSTPCLGQHRHVIVILRKTDTRVRSLIRILQRLAILGLGVLSVWLIVFVFKWVDRRISWILALSVTYGLAAYVILPRAVRMGLKIL